jgi:hypothetical protein
MCVLIVTHHFIQVDNCASGAIIDISKQEQSEV